HRRRSRPVSFKDKFGASRSKQPDRLRNGKRTQLLETEGRNALDKLACPGCFIGIAAQPIVGIIGKVHSTEFRIVSDIPYRVLPEAGRPCEEGRRVKLPYEPLHRARRMGVESLFDLPE